MFSRRLLPALALIVACGPAPLPAPPPAQIVVPPAAPPPAPPPATASAAPTVAPAPSGPPRVVVVCNDCGAHPISHVYFAPGSAAISREAAPTLREVAAVMKAHPEVTSVAVEGHADDREGRPGDVSRRRAEAVRDWLVKRGVEAGRLSITAHGSARPIDNPASAEGRARNRRVEFRVMERKDP